MLENYIKEHQLDNALQEVCKILCSGDPNQITTLENTFLNICSHIGSNIDIHTTLRWIDILKRTQSFITSEEIHIDETLILTCMLCLLCREIHVSKLLPLNQLRARVIQSFNTKLSPHEERAYDKILPTQTSDSFAVASSILSGYLKLLGEIKDVSQDDRQLYNLSNRLRLCVEYVTRKNVYIEHNDNRDPDNIWFVWNVMDALTGNPAPIKIANDLFNYKWNPKNKKNRQGLLWGCAFVVVLTHRNNVSKSWVEENVKMFNKVREMTPIMIKKIRSEMPKPPKETQTRTMKDMDPIEILMNFVPSARSSTFSY